MVSSENRFAGGIPEIYERLFVPILFEPYAQDLAARVSRLSARDILETAAGTGVLTRALAAQLPASVRIVATDLNQPMLNIAAARQADDRRISPRQADALNLPFEDQTFDAVVCQFGAMFFPDKVRAYGEARRVLRQGGRFLFSVWDKIAENEFADVTSETLAALFGEDAPDFMARIPHGYYDVEKIRDELTEAGFDSIAVETIQLVSKASSAREAAIAFCKGTPIRNQIEDREPARLDEATDAVADALARRFGDYQLEGRMRAHVFAAAR
jgi:ubiquinone/menaquinone biosynthesis C-methylase UbiE